MIKYLVPVGEILERIRMCGLLERVLLGVGFAASKNPLHSSLFLSSAWLSQVVSSQPGLPAMFLTMMIIESNLKL